jgi:hypothetical protein
MNSLTKSTLALAVLATATLSGAAQAQTTFSGTNLSVKEQTSLVTGGYLYTYNVTPTFSTNLVTFSFTDPTVSIFGTPTGPLNFISPAGTGNFVNFSLTGGVLAGGATETVQFTSPDAPGGILNTATSGSFVGSAGLVTNITAPAAVPEASTTISFGLLLMLGLGGLVIAARKKSAPAAV